MPRPDPTRPRAGQLGLFETEAVKQPDQVLRGRHSEAMDRALVAAKEQDALGVIDDGLVTVLRAGAWSLDAFESQNKPYGPSKIIEPMVNALREARLTPDSRAAAADDEVKALLEALADDEDDDTHTAPAPHTEDARR